MWNNYIKISLRNILKSKGYSFITIFGLSVGLASCLLILNYIRFELSFDKTHPDVDRLYRVNQTLIWAPGGGIFSSSGPQLAYALKEDYPEVEEVTRINTPGDYIVSYANEMEQPISYRENSILAADSNFFSFFDFRLKEGNPKTALTGMNKVVISEEVAKKFFGNEPALGKILLLGKKNLSVEITGVTFHQPKNMHFHFDYLLSMYTNTGVKQFEWSYIWTQVVTYVKLKPATNVAELQEKIQSIADRRIKPSFATRLGMDYDEFIKDKGGWHFYLQPVQDIRLRSASVFGRFEEVSDINYLYIFGGICILILLIAVINFVNLATARASLRAKEVGVKKTLGAVRRSLVIQFQFESIFTSVIATVLALGLMVLLKPVIYEATGFDLPFSIWNDPELLIWIALLPLVIGFLAGLYPAFYLTAFRPAHVLKGKVTSGIKSGGLRSALVLIQFVIAITVMSVTFVVFQQIRFMSGKNLGFDKENLLVLHHAAELGKQLESFRNELQTMQGVKSATIVSEMPGSGNTNEDIFGAEGVSETLPINITKIDHQFFSTLNLQLLSGRMFGDNSPSDSASVIINENTARLFGWTAESALGKRILYPGGGSQFGRLEVIGVVKDFHFRSLHVNISPIIFFSLNSPMWGNFREIAIKFQTSDVAALRQKIESKWNGLAGGTPFDFSFYESDLEKQYQNERRLAGLFAIFTGFSIGVGVIGLLGLVAYSADQRKKEIGIRKVFGASVSSIFVMINKNYVILMIIALLVAAPLSWLALDKWLSAFAFRVTISPVVFLISGLAEFVLSVLCVTYLSMKAAGVNPARVLKEE